MYDSLSSRVASEMFGSDDDGTDLDSVESEDSNTFKMKTPSWLLPAALGAAGGAGLTALGFSLFRKKGKRKAAVASFAGVDPRQIDARKNDLRGGTSYGGLRRSDLFGALNSESLFAEEEYGALNSPSLFAEEDYGFMVPLWAQLQGRELRIYTDSHSLQDLSTEQINRLLTRRSTTEPFRHLLEAELARRSPPLAVF